MEFEKLQQIIAEVLNVEPDEITMDTTFVDDLGADSLDVFQIIMGIEEEFDIEIPNEAAESIVTAAFAPSALTAPLIAALAVPLMLTLLFAPLALTAPLTFAAFVALIFTTLFVLTSPFSVALTAVISTLLLLALIAFAPLTVKLPAS